VAPGSTQILHCRIVSLDEAYELAARLCEAVRASGYRPELVLAIARGGFVPARLVCDLLPCPELASLTIRHYEPGALKNEAPELRQPLTAPVAGLCVLVVDDVNASGGTLEAARRHLAERGAAEVRVAVLHEKPGSRARADLCAARSPDDQWLLYQWALVEDTIGFLARLEPRPRSEGEARERLAREFGLELDDAQWRRVVSVLEPPLG
jgi:hypoxanthine phosphoribosyltransferase